MTNQPFFTKECDAFIPTDAARGPRVAVAADFASPFANAGDHGLGYINSDVTLYLHRLPEQQWIGFEVVNHHATDGVAIGECFLYDQQGPIGTSTVAALAQRKPILPKPPAA
jgi:Thioesterase-like superfamily